MLFVVVITFGVGACAAVGYIGLRHVPLVLWLARHGQRTVGSVIDEEIEGGGRGGVRYFPIVSFRDARGDSHRLRSRFAAGRRLRGDQVVVAYDPASPGSRSEVMRWRSIIPEVVTALIVLLVAMSLTLGVVWAAFVQYH